MAFQRRFYYEQATGKMLSSSMMEGSFVSHGQDWDYQYDGALQPYADRRDEVRCFEWTEKDAEVERQFRESFRQYVDVSGPEPVLMFDYTPPPPPPDPPPSPELIEAYQAGGDAVLALLTGGGKTDV